jgi:hypothetical protein
MLFDRDCSLVIGPEGGKGVELSGLRIAFAIQKGATKSPNKCNIRVWNTSVTTRAVLDVIGNIVILKAGYKQDIGAVTIFSGNITRSLTVREGPDWVTELELEDGFLEFRDMKVALSFDGGVTALQVVTNVSKRFGLPVRPIPTDIATATYPSGFAFVGRVRDAMDKVCEYAGLEWSIQNREIQVIKKGGIFQQRAYVLSAASGLVGSPSKESKTMTEKAAAKDGITSAQAGVRRTTKKDKDGTIQQMLQVFGYKVTTLLQPLIEPGGYVQLKTVGIDGDFFRVEEVVHQGDTHGNDWHSELTLRFEK